MLILCLLLFNIYSNINYYICENTKSRLHGDFFDITKKNMRVFR